MEFFLTLFLISLLNYSKEIVPNWKISGNSINLLTSSTYTYTVTYLTKPIEDSYVLHVELKKTITRDTDGIRHLNKLYCNTYEKEYSINFENIESIYQLNEIERTIFICPRGKHHVFNTNDGKEKKPNGFSESESSDWDLKCYNHGTGFFIDFYLNKVKPCSYATDVKTHKNLDNSWKTNSASPIDILLDFKLEDGNVRYDSTYNGGSGRWITYPMLSLVLHENAIKLMGLTAEFKNEKDGYKYYIYKTNEKKLIDNKSITQAYFKNNSNDFFFITYNNATDFTSGYSKNYNPSNYHDTSNPPFEINSESPFEFLDEVEINEMNFLLNNKYVYYKITNKQTNEIYHGILDVVTNKIMFNTNETINEFIPYSSNSMLAITGETAYRICIIKTQTGDNTNDCIDECTSPNRIIRDSEGNKCGTSCDNPNKYLLVPDDICINECDTRYYISDISDENGKRCGLCKDLDNQKPYRLIGGTECIAEIPIGGYEYNSKLKLLKCKSGYILNENTCIPHCYSTCSICSEYSENPDSQKCLNCTSGYYLDGEQCIEIVLPVATTTILIIPTTEIKNEPSTIITNKPSTIITNEPSTIITIEPITTITIPPTTVTTYSPTTMVAIIPTTEIALAPTTIVSTIPKTIPKLVCPDEKCLTCNEASNSLGLCLSCNEEKGYRKINYTLVLTNFLDCIKPSNPGVKKFYYNETLQLYRPCYKTCKSCSKGGNAEENYCLECETDYMFRPGNNPYNNCVAFSEYYYMSSYNQYKSLKVYQCPEEAKYYIIDKKSCIDDCKKDSEYKYLYNGHCLKECPSGTASNSHYVCIINDNNKCILGKNEIFLSENDNLEIIGTLIKTYISEFDYTKRYVTIYENNNYVIMIYKDTNCIKELNIEIPNVEFQSCYTKVQNAYGITEELIIVIVDRKILHNAKTFYSFYHPLSGAKLNADEICKNETIVVVESLSSKLSKNDTNYETQTSLASQGINIFNLDDPFYTDICYDFDNPLKKDIPLNDRIKHIYPDVELCDEGCQYKGINLEDMTATCDCAFNDITNNNLIKDNALLEGAVGEIFDMINSSNILVFKCFKNIFKHFSRSIGGWISLGLITVQIGLSLTFFLVQSKMVSKYIYDLTSKFISVINNIALAPPKRVKLIDNKNKNKNINNKQTITQQVSQTNLNNKKLIISDIAKVSVDELIVPIKEENKLKTSENAKIDNMGTLYNIKQTKNDGGDDQIFNKNFFEEYLSTSPEDMEFDDAIVKDKRKYCEHMKENLIEDQIITATFVSEDPLKPRTIKIMVFILNLVLYFVVNGLFFSEEVISDLYNVNEEDENFFSYLPRSINRLLYTTLVSVVVSIITDFFFIDEKKIKGIFRREKTNIKILREKIKDIMNDLKKRYIAFIIVVSIILILSFFYLLCFNYVYPYTQIEWIKSSITIMIIMQILSLLKCILETSLRYLSYKFKSEKLYKISKILD